MVNMFWFLVEAALLLLSFRISNGLDIINFHEFCGSTITKNAGQLQFDARKLPSYLPGSKCSVTISLQGSMFNTKTQVLFYFTKFDISMFCEDTNVTAIDGTQYSGTQIAGLPTEFCGHNKTLEDPAQVFTTNSNQLTVIFKRSDYGKRFSGNFSIKYVEFHSGTCEEQGTYKCDNGRCIPNAYSCSNEINACGRVQDNCNNDEEAATSFLDSVVDILRNLLWIVAIMVALYLFRCFYQRYHERIRSVLGRLTSDQSLTNRRLSSGAQSVQLDACPSNDVLSQDQDQPELIHSSSGRISPSSVISTNSSRSFSFSGNDVISDGMEETTLDTQHNSYSSPSCPPPSYEEVMGNK